MDIYTHIHVLHCTVLARFRCGGSVLLKVIFGVSVLIAVQRQKPGSHRQSTRCTQTYWLLRLSLCLSLPLLVRMCVSRYLPAFLRTQALHFRALGAFGALRAPVRGESPLTVDLQRKRFQRPHRAPLTFIGAHCRRQQMADGFNTSS